MDATDLPPNHEISESGAVLHLYNVQYEDVGGYDCEAINTKGKDWHKAWVYVECESGALVSSTFLLLVSLMISMFTFVVPAAPEWAETINNTQIDIGSEHTMRCVAMGKPAPFIRWYKDGYMVKVFTQFKPRFPQKLKFTLAVCVSQYGKGELQFSSLTFADSGMYQCVAENYWGIKYANAELRVIGKNMELRRTFLCVFFFVVVCLFADNSFFFSFRSYV